MRQHTGSGREAPATEDHPRRTRGLFQLGVLSMALSCFACEDEPQQGGRGVSDTPASAAKTNKPAAQKVLETLVYKDDDFVESERNRDPFRSYAASFRGGGKGGEPTPETQRSVIMPNTAVEEMRLIAIISGLTRPKAMLTDQRGVGYVVQRGDYLGRPKVFQTTGSVAMTLNWRVDRIRDNEVVLTRQDPSDPGRPPLSRIISMRDEIAAR
jgi:type IV pilus assembly protein PilP